MTKPRPLLFSLVSALLGMSLVAGALLELPGSQIIPLGQYLIGANTPMAALVLGIGFLVAAAEPAIQTTFVRLAIIYAVASVLFQLIAGSQLGNHTLAQGIVIPLIAAILLVVLHPSPRAIIPVGSSTRPATNPT